MYFCVCVYVCICACIHIFILFHSFTSKRKISLYISPKTLTLHKT